MKALRIGSSLLLFAGTSWAQQYLMSTVAGGAPPPTPSPAVSVSIGSPEGMATDTAGNAYFTSLNCVFKLDLKGNVTRVAGTSRAGYSGDGGAATAAQLFSPNGVAVDSAGNIFVADVGNNRVRRVSNGVIATVAGGGTASLGDGGPAANATLYSPNGVAVDGQGNLFIADSNNNRIRKVSASGVITTVAGNGAAGFSGDGGPAAGAQLSQPQYVAVDAQGNVYIADTGNNRVRKVSANGVISTLAGNGVAGYSGDGGPAANAALQNPQGVAVDGSSDVFIVDSDNHRVRQVSTAGTITTVAGTGVNGFTGDGGAAISAQLNGANGVAVDAAGDIFLAVYYSQRVREVSANGIINTVAGAGGISSGDNGPATSAQFSSVTGVAADASGNFYIADNSRLRKVAPSGIVTTVAGTGDCCGPGPSGVAATSAQISPESVAVDASGNLFIADFFSVVHKVSSSGIITTVAGNGTAGFAGDNGPATNAELGNSPEGLAIDAQGNLYIADTSNNRVRRVTPGGIITTFAGNGTAGFAGDGGQAVAAQLSAPESVAVDSAGNLYIADSNNNRIRRVSPAGVINTVAGSGTGGFSGDGGPAAAAQLQRPLGVAADGQGNLYIADTINNRIREVSANGTIATIAGSGNSGYSGDCSVATNAQIAFPQDVAVDGSGNVYIADSDNTAVRRLQPATQAALVCAVVDAASQSSIPVSPGKIVVVYGTGLGPSSIVYGAPVNGVFGDRVAGTAVTFNGIAAPLIYSLAGQISAITPYEITGTTAQITVSFQGQSSSFTVPVASVAPSLFTANESGIGQAAAINNVDGSYNTAADPVQAGAYIQLYATGEGQTFPAGIDGAVAASALPLPAPVLPVQVTVGGVPATIAYAGAAPGSVAGLMQVDVLIPGGIQPASEVPVVLQVGTTATTALVWIAVSGN